MSDKVGVNSGGLGFVSILTIIFVIAKLLGVVKWSWWVVFSPMLLSAYASIITLISLLMVIVIGVWVGSK